MPVEHGGWGLTLEPGILGVLLAPSLAAMLPGVAVRAPVQRLHGRAVAPRPAVIGDMAAVGTAGLAAFLEPSLLVATAAIVGLVVVQRSAVARPPRPAKVLGARQMALGFAVVGLTALGVWIQAAGPRAGDMQPRAHGPGSI